MLMTWQYGKPADGEKEKLLRALGVTNDLYDPCWPLPNLRPSDEREFWGWMASHGPQCRIWLGSKTIANQNATVLAYWMGETRPSFAVAVIYRNTVAHHPVYYRWTACEHDYQISKSGHCWREYKCAKCGVSYQEDSSG